MGGSQPAQEKDAHRAGEKVLRCLSLDLLVKIIGQHRPKPEHEEIEREGLMVLKRDGRHEEFSREKLLSGIRKACQKRPVTPKAMEDLVDHIVATVSGRFENEVPGEFIGTMVMDGLRTIDDVAYVRFASVYRRFQEATDFVQEVKKLEAQQ